MSIFSRGSSADGSGQSIAPSYRVGIFAGPGARMHACCQLTGAENEALRPVSWLHRGQHTRSLTGGSLYCTGKISKKVRPTPRLLGLRPRASTNSRSRYARFGDLCPLPSAEIDPSTGPIDPRSSAIDPRPMSDELESSSSPRLGLCVHLPSPSTRACAPYVAIGTCPACPRHAGVAVAYGVLFRF